MEISIPDRVQFVDDSLPIYTRVCFRHAVIRALKGKSITTELTEHYTTCDVCAYEAEHPESVDKPDEPVHDDTDGKTDTEKQAVDRHRWVGGKKIRRRHRT